MNLIYFWHEGGRRYTAMAVYDKAYELARELKSSDEYREYQKAKDSILSNESARSILRDYRKAELQYQAFALSGQEPPDNLKQELQRLKNVVDMHGPVKRFLEAERRVLIMLADIQRILTDAMNLLEEV